MIGRVKGSDGFTIVELSVTIAIVGILAAIVIPYFVPPIERARVATVQSNLHEVMIAVQSFSAYNDGYYPTSETELETSLRQSLVNPYDHREALADMILWNTAPVTSRPGRIGYVFYGDSMSPDSIHIEGATKDTILAIILR